MKIRNLLAIMMCVLILLSFAGCAAAEMDKAVSSNGAYAPEAGMDIAYGSAPGDFILRDETTQNSEKPADGESTSNLPANRKLIQTVNMDVETEDLDAVLQQIDSRIAELNGYVESSNVQNGSAYSGRRYRYADMTIRIPAKELEIFINKVGEVSNIVSSRKTVEDITLSYVATESRVKALQTEEARLLELLAQAETMDDLLTIESRLTDVRTELEQVSSALRVFDNQVDYATIHLNISEVKEYTEVKEPETVWQRIGVGFTKSLKGVGKFFKELFVFLVVASPYLVLIAAIALTIIFIVRSSVRRKRRKRDKERELRKQAEAEKKPDEP